MAFAEDYSEFLDPDEFAKIANINGYEVNGILNREFASDEGVEGTTPVFSCASADVVNCNYNDKLMVDGDTYIIVQKRTDGTGMTDLILELQS